jgi:hypothetical protein
LPLHPLALSPLCPPVIQGNCNCSDNEGSNEQALVSGKSENKIIHKQDDNQKSEAKIEKEFPAQLPLRRLPERGLVLVA